jgi:hypothetical protein
VSRASARRAGTAGLSFFVGACLAAADTLVLRSGRRVEGELIAVRGDTIEFRERRGLFGSGRVNSYDRQEVARIELDEQAGTPPRDSSESGRPSGLRERQVSVAADQAWTDTGLEVRSGQRVSFEASGRIHWGPDRRDGPAGEGGSHHNPNRPMPSRPGAALIGKVGDSRDYFFVGAGDGPIRMRSSGRLYLGINDDYLQDNSGSFRVVVYY